MPWRYEEDVNILHRDNNRRENVLLSSISPASSPELAHLSMLVGLLETETHVEQLAMTAFLDGQKSCYKPIRSSSHLAILTNSDVNMMNNVRVAFIERMFQIDKFSLRFLQQFFFSSPISAPNGWDVLNWTLCFIEYDSLLTSVFYRAEKIPKRTLLMLSLASPITPEVYQFNILKRCLAYWPTSSLHLRQGLPRRFSINLDYPHQ